MGNFYWHIPWLHATVLTLYLCSIMIATCFRQESSCKTSNCGGAVCWANQGNDLPWLHRRCEWAYNRCWLTGIDRHSDMHSDNLHLHPLNSPSKIPTKVESDIQDAVATKEVIRSNERYVATMGIVGVQVTKKFSEWKQAHVGMEP